MKWKIELGRIVKVVLLRCVLYKEVRRGRQGDVAWMRVFPGRRRGGGGGVVGRRWEWADVCTVEGAEAAFEVGARGTGGELHSSQRVVCSLAPKRFISFNGCIEKRRDEMYCYQ